MPRKFSVLDVFLPEGLKINYVYPANFVSLSNRISKFDNNYDPFIKITDHYTNVSYSGFLIFSTSKFSEEKKIANQIRDKLIKRGVAAARPFHVKIVEKPLFNINGPYLAIGTKEPLYVDYESIYVMQPYNAFEVLTGKNVHYGRCMSIDKDGYPEILVFDEEETPLTGKLIISKENIIGVELSLNIRGGDFLLVRKLNIEKDKLFFEPVINFSESDLAKDKNGNDLVTIITGYEKGDKILNLPILNVERNSVYGSVGKGYVKNKSKSDYVPVEVIGGSGYKGRYIDELYILDIINKVIIAEKKK